MMRYRRILHATGGGLLLSAMACFSSSKSGDMPDAGGTEPDATAPDAPEESSADAPADVSMTPVEASVDAPAPEAGQDGGPVAEAGADASTDAGACPGGQTLCGATCVDTSSDFHNCGGCSVVCGPDGVVTVCALGRCVETLASTTAESVGPPGATTLAVDSTSVYWTYPSTPGSIMSIPKTGGASVLPVPIATGQAAPEQMVVDGNNAYWINYGDFTVMQAPLSGSATGDGGPDGGAPIQLASAANLPASGAQQIYGIAVDAANVYFASANQTTAEYVWKVPIGGGTVTKLVTDSNYSVSPRSMTLDANNVYWGTNNYYVLAAPKTGGSVELVAAVPGGVSAITLVGTTLYYTANGLGGSSLFEIASSSTTPPDGGAYQTVATTGPNHLQPNGIATDGVNLYWSNYTGPTQPSIMKVALGGGTPTVLATGITNAGWIAVDATSVYWADDGSNGTAGRIMKITPK